MTTKPAVEDVHKAVEHWGSLDWKGPTHPMKWEVLDLLFAAARDWLSQQASTVVTRGNVDQEERPPRETTDSWMPGLFVHELHVPSSEKGIRPKVRPATVADLVDALIAEGGEIRSLWSWSQSGKRREMEPGRYLVFPILVEEETTT